ncbi:S1-C subfamily serine protease [Variovorax sp. SG517]|uniref:hypothetical protein n=1 Tax=Variovorax sp. SG517 TaxID=2587117 RepID=UPI00159E137B|nr:hypothetical protein [Variovorax sp. SG517]NVM87893.1 S1-C subfamily serine protease [Variovorax sp. SG517]
MPATNSSTSPAAGTVRFATLGPGGTNHELITRRYLASQGIDDFEIKLILSFKDAITMLLEDTVDYVMQCAVHPETPQTLGENFRSVFAIDCFISDSQELAVLSRRDVQRPESIGVLLPANEKYTDLSRWKQVVSYSSLPLINEALLVGEIDSGLVYRAYADKHPEVLRVDEVIGSPDDVWIVYGRKRAFKEKLIGFGDGAFLDDVRVRLTERAAARPRAAVHID